MARVINLATPDCGVSDGMELSFRAPCGCSDVTGIKLDGVTYALVDASGGALTGCSGYFDKDAILTVIIDMTKSKATLLNPRVNTYTKTLGTSEDTPSADGSVWSRVKKLQSDVEGKAPTSHNHTKDEITDFAHNHDERYYTEDEIDNKFKSYATTADMNIRLGDKADYFHLHDEYVTQSTYDGSISNIYTTMGGKAPNVHSHKKADITDFPTSMPASDVYAWAKASKKPTYTASEVGASPTGHTHDEIDALETWKSGVENGTTAVPIANKLVHKVDEVSVPSGTLQSTAYNQYRALVVAIKPTEDASFETTIVLVGKSTPTASGYYCERSLNPNELKFRNPSGYIFAPYAVRIREL